MRSAEFERGRAGPNSQRIADSTPAEFGADWSELEHTIRACRRCHLGSTRANAVIYRGDPTPHIVFVGEAPGAAEDQLGLPFVGRSGQRLDAAIAGAGIRPDEFGILNLIKCRPPKNLFDRAAATTCRPYLDRQLSILQPRVLVSLGAHALRALDPAAPRVLLAAGRARPLEKATLFPMIHPAAALRSRAMTRRWQSDFVTFRNWLAAPSAAPAREPS